MELNLKNSIIITDENGNQKEYKRLALSLSTSTGYNNVDEYTFALRLVPFRIDEEGNVDRLEDETISHSFLNVLDSNFKDCGNSILEALQKEINNF